MRLSSILLIVHSLCLTITVAQNVSLAEPNCPEKCGNVTIPYPFGIGSECSANSWFTVICNDTNPPKPFLSNISLEALEFSLTDHTVRVMRPVSLLDCAPIATRILLGKSILGSPFTFSPRHNRMVAIGRNTAFWIRNSNKNFTAGCIPIAGRNTGCKGINCCRSTIPPRLQELRILYFTGRNNASSCGYVFPADERWLVDQENTSFLNPLDISLDYVSVVLEWEFFIPKETPQGTVCEKERTYNSSSLDENDIVEINTTRCYCDRGFAGNPYLPGGGCQDINECSDATLNDCRIGTCINTIGSFKCSDGRVRTIIGISGGIGALLLLSGGWMSSKVVKKTIEADRTKKNYNRNGGSLLEQKLPSNDGGVEKIKLFNSKELAQATDNYNGNRILDHGGQDTVYKGMLTDGKIVAIEKSERVDKVGAEVFIEEVVILSEINNENVVQLLGCCLETDVPLLVYEYISIGTLSRHIHDRKTEDFPLSWKMRLRIAADVAGALSYLHNDASVPIYHRDIKSENILLDKNYRAKLLDLGTSRSIAIDQTRLSTKNVPEYSPSTQFTEKSDVYSFGIIMVELLTGQKAISTEARAKDFLQSMKESRLNDILDPIFCVGCPKEEIVRVAELARECLDSDGEKRPAMKDVAEKLEGIPKSKDPSSSDNTNLDAMPAESS